MAITPRPLGLYLGEDGRIWVEDAELNRGWVINPASGPATNYPVAPAEPTTSLPPIDGNLYGILNQSWSQIIMPVPPIASDAPSDGQMYVRQSGVWVPRPQPLIQVITTPGSFTFTIPAGASVIRAICIGAGMGGCSGRKTAVGTAGAGGQGGGGGAYSVGEWAVANLPFKTLWGFVGGGAIGGVPVTANDTNGNPPTQGPVGNTGTWFGNTATSTNNAYHALIYAAGGLAGVPGSTVASVPTAVALGDFPGGAPGGNSITGNSPQPAAFSGKGAGGGAGGGGINAAGSTAYNGGTGAPCGNGAGYDLSYGVGGVAPGGNGANGGNQKALDGNNPFTPGTGGGGGAASLTGNAGNGGNGASYGAGGGGGGAALDNVGNSGAGGNGANGLVILMVFF